MIQRPQPAVSPPAFLSRWQSWIVLAALLLVPFFVPIPVELRKHLLIGPLGDQLHVPLLGGFTLLLYWQGPLRGRLWWSALAAILTGALIEVLQQLVGRAARFDDILLDLVGTGLVVGFILWKGHGRIAGLVLLVILLLAIPFDLRELPQDMRARQFHNELFPLLDDFENPHLERMWGDVGGGMVGFPPIPDGPRGPTFVLQITGSPPQGWPGARMAHFPYDWRDYQAITLDARHRGPDDWIVSFSVQLEDFAGRRVKARFITPLIATAEWQTFQVPLQNRRSVDGDRILDLADIEGMSLFLNAPYDTLALELDNIRLVK